MAWSGQGRWNAGFPFGDVPGLLLFSLRFTNPIPEGKLFFGIWRKMHLFRSFSYQIQVEGQVGNTPRIQGIRWVSTDALYDFKITKQLFNVCMLSWLCGQPDSKGRQNSPDLRKLARASKMFVVVPRVGSACPSEST